MKKIIFLAFTAICILLSGCETNEPQDVYISNDSIYIKNDTVYVENMDLETFVNGHMRMAMMKMHQEVNAQ